MRTSVPERRSWGGPAASPGGTRPLVLVTGPLAVEWPPLGLGVRALAVLSERRPSGWGGADRPGARGVPRLMLASLVLGELPIRDAMVGVAVLD